ncbi:hypothetical protein A8990_14719 [Paenibacillus taihuensis]|uniref:Uncharacterized protein n=1 Tax=Paenibacillus taihuensis TaxID=1156355 RepID=A0A3D9QZX1_9BACL|nr:hypothetical protein A8990_14719 [Paenibacillus taihuensis]
MENFLIFVAPVLVVVLSVAFLFWWGARVPRKKS